MVHIRNGGQLYESQSYNGSNNSHNQRKDLRRGCVIDDQTVVIKGGYIQAVGGAVPVGATVIDAHGATLMPGLIDSHVHTDMDGLHDALKFGVTTELEMMGRWSAEQRK